MITELYTVYRAELMKYCCLICGNVSDAEDLLQETFMKALSNLDLLEDMGEKERRAWLYRVARNMFYDSCRRQAVEQSHMSRSEEETEVVFPILRQSCFCHRCHQIFPRSSSSAISRAITPKSLQKNTGFHHQEYVPQIPERKRALGQLHGIPA